jgi:hypothetical protein
MTFIFKSILRRNSQGSEPLRLDACFEVMEHSTGRLLTGVIEANQARLAPLIDGERAP